MGTRIYTISSAIFCKINLNNLLRILDLLKHADEKSPSAPPPSACFRRLLRICVFCVSCVICVICVFWTYPNICADTVDYDITRGWRLPPRILTLMVVEATAKVKILRPNLACRREPGSNPGKFSSMDVMSTKTNSIG